MTLKEYLSQATALNMLIDTRLELISELRSRIMTSRSFLSCSDGSVGQSAVESITEKICLLEESVTAEIDRYVDIKAEISDFISLLGDYSLRAIMLSRYINGKRWETISEETFISVRNLQYLHSKALKELSEYYNRNENKSA